MTDAFFEIHSSLDREGPGDRDSLDWALELARVPKDARILDAGCGPGADIAGLLHHAPEGHVTALDSHAPFIDAVRARHAGDSRVTAEVADMLAADGPFDLIWCAGAVYFAGVTEALTAWTPRLTGSKIVAFSQLAWKSSDRPTEAAAFWAEGYPPMTDRDGVLTQVQEAGYRIVAARFLPDAAWEAYYTPLGRRVAFLRSGEVPDDLAEALDAEEREMALWRAHRDAFGYLQVVATPE
ncbi:class I SAM-dependent methyltransferase [Anianabacter salinae]|uniref:class I SAM-dependent methyltransferase n=1 Tax=Anianabacter salinae TaxID=2851023 RepID=UPI00225E2781|nr:class I SAM-dependent methyltransferase [Anianabacter salinae]MBV0911919.1 methyltransferase domain-containing protein [Anianabacter salinae]